MMDVKLVRFINYVQAVMTLHSKQANKYRLRTGQTLLDKETVRKRLEICYKCDEFNGERCKLCGCCTNAKQSHFNKLAFPTEQCPLEKWQKVD